MKELLDTPDKMVEDGRPAFGRFRTAFKQVNMLDANPSRLHWAPRGFLNFRLKEWEHFSIITPTHFLGIAVVDAKYMGVSWCYALDRRTKAMVVHERQLVGKAQPIGRELYDAHFSFKDKDYEVSVHNYLIKGLHHLSYATTGPKNPPLTGRFEIYERPEDTQPMISVLPIGKRKVFYSHKAACPVSGEYSVAGENFTADPAASFALTDVHKAYYPFRTTWKWATFACRDAEGTLLGLNLTEGVFGDGGDMNENCIWHGNRMSLLSAAKFEIPADIMQPWTVSTVDGRSSLVFTPMGLRSQTLDLKLVRSWYMAPLGEFTGFLVDDDGVKHEVKKAFGICEHHRVTW